MIYAVINTKGGVGKTTIAVHLAKYLSEKGETLLIDGDPQLSAATWAAWRRDNDRKPNPTTATLSGKAIFAEGKNLSQNYKNTVIDAGGRDSPGMRSALLMASKAIIPIGASNLDAAAMDDLLSIVEEANSFNDKLKLFVLLSRIDTRTKDTADMADFLKEKKLHLCNSIIYERVAVRRAIGEGATVGELSADTNAVNEFNAFFQEVTK